MYSPGNDSSGKIKTLTNYIVHYFPKFIYVAIQLFLSKIKILCHLDNIYCFEFKLIAITSLSYCL